MLVIKLGKWQLDYKRKKLKFQDNDSHLQNSYDILHVNH